VLVAFTKRPEMRSVQSPTRNPVAGFRNLPHMSRAIGSECAGHDDNAQKQCKESKGSFQDLRTFNTIALPYVLPPPSDFFMLKNFGLRARKPAGRRT